MKKFRDMTDGEKLEVINRAQNKQPLEYCEYESGEWLAVPKNSPLIGLDCYYRTPKRPMSIDWSVLKDEYICAAKQQGDNGKAFAYEKEPSLNYKHGIFETMGGVAMPIIGLKSYDPGTVDWKDSLIWRPGYSPDKKENNNG